jgi:aminomethyltransferase
VPRKGYEVFASGMRVGVVTSGTFSPTLGQGIALAYVDVVYAQEGTGLQIDVRGKRYQARVVKRPFYSRRRNEK